MKKCSAAILFLFCALGGLAQQGIPSNASYLGEWVLDDDTQEDGPVILGEFGHNQLIFNSEIASSLIGFYGRDELGWPFPYEYMAEVKGNRIEGTIVDAVGLHDEKLIGTTFSFDFEHDPITDVFVLIWKGKRYSYTRR